MRVIITGGTGLIGRTLSADLASDGHDVIVLSRSPDRAKGLCRQIKQFCEIDGESSELLEKAMDKFGLSARAHARILKIARTIADLEGSSHIKALHVAEAIQYRTLDRRNLR